jgi:hypothetical protein
MYKQPLFFLFILSLALSACASTEPGTEDAALTTPTEQTESGNTVTETSVTIDEGDATNVGVEIIEE